ncbi:MAG: hypothetical protein A4E63_00221 [Syntrophorhabdus sp. PtaU1.Bin050]|nr:MAG: hypothetical protein A4E63_00221 [Syntrophorhabdus sp. PtaU1.Bin050]
MRDKLILAERKKLDHIRGEMSRSEYLRMLIETKYNEDRKAFLDRMKLYRQIRYVEHILAVGKRLNERKEKDNEEHIGQTE